MTDQFSTLLLSELHMAVFKPGRSDLLTDELLAKAMTVNENLRSLGYVLKPADICALAVSVSLNDFYDSFKRMIPEVKAAPMYPDFPNQVMTISEAEFRMHQLLHYFSTYGMEFLFGEKVSRGWLPCECGTEKTESDNILLEAKVLDLVAEDKVFLTVLKRILGRRERMTIPEKRMILEAVNAVSANDLQTVTVAFKENLSELFALLLNDAERDVCIRTLSVLCCHTGDVFKCIHEVLRASHYHLTTSKKKTLVRLIEQYPVWNLRENLMRSNKQREKNLVVLRHLDYNKYALSAEHAEAVRALRNDELLSWEGEAEALLRVKDPSALAFLAKRPGMMLRKMNRLLSLGYDEDEILLYLGEHAAELSPQTLVQTMRAFCVNRQKLESERTKETEACRRRYQMKRNNMPGASLWDYQVKQWQLYKDFEKKEYELSENGIRERKMRDFQDADERSGMNAYQRQKMMLDTKLDAWQKELEALLPMKSEVRRRIRFVSDASHTIDWNRLVLYFLPEAYDQKCSGLVQQIEQSKKLLEEMEQNRPQLQSVREAMYAEIESRYEIETTLRYEKLSELRAALNEQLEALRTEMLEEMRQADRVKAEKLKVLDVKEAEEMSGIEQKYQSGLKRLENMTIVKRMLGSLMLAHFKCSETALKGRKIFVDMPGFDLVHSVIEANAKSAEGGYIRSGIAYKIPEDAKYVRFFVYWNDSWRVDIDLHAGGFKMDGSSLQIGWNADFRNDGAVYSGDITHSNAAEYIDVDLSAPIREIYTNIHLYSGKSGFDEVEECFVGMMAVEKAHESVQHYHPANCFFTHRLLQHTENLYYGYVDVQNRYVKFIGQNNGCSWYSGDQRVDMDGAFSLQDYLDILFEAQQAELVASADEADVILTMGKGLDERSVSLADENFFLES